MHHFSFCFGWSGLGWGDNLAGLCSTKLDPLESPVCAEDESEQDRIVALIKKADVGIVICPSAALSMKMLPMQCPLHNSIGQHWFQWGPMPFMRPIGVQWGQWAW